MHITTRIIVITMMIFTSLAHAQDYMVGKGDVIDIKVFQHPDLDATLRVSDSGRVNMHLVGGINLEGKSEEQIEQIIENALQSGGFINSPQVSVVVTEYSDRKASVLGKVHSPGEYSITSGDTIIDVISKAGGLLDDGNTKITLRRRGQQAISFDLYSTDPASEINQSSQIQTGDVIDVGLADVFYTYGEVNNPGEYILRDKMTVMKAISISGGLTNKASKRKIFIVRDNDQGESETTIANLGDVVNASDVILVEESLF